MGAAVKMTMESFEKDVVAGRMPAVIDFGATWCGPCQALAPAIDRLAAEYAGRVLIAKVDVEEEPDLAASFDVMSVPTIIFFKDGKKVDQIQGNFPDRIRKRTAALIEA
jgi:thioredoxin 1